ncbi:hypothetical protein CUR178_07304 [Leishmania enriettii]|uniref:Uncharacterized protein n=1 Tax=Leishmania enriettii TaxID=5663 RepID=A0A836HWH4_LEIEN|nr:hypothetical protein CUR178_07304 [Leishmania enriettii]
MRGVGCAQCRGFVDVPIADEAVVSCLTRPDASSPDSTVEDNPTPSHAGSSYTHSLDVGKASFRLYGESAKYAADDPSRILFSASVHSYNPAILFSDLRLRGERHKSLSLSSDLGAGGAGDTPLPGGGPVAETRMSEDEESDAVTRSGRNKHGAVIYDSRRAADGIAIVPGHLLPVVFPRPDGPLPPHLKKPTLGDVHKAGAGTRAHHLMCGSEEDLESIMRAEVMESQRCAESYSL